MYTAQNAAIPDCQTQMLDDCSLHNSSCDECIGFSPDCFWCTLLPVSDMCSLRVKPRQVCFHPAGKVVCSTLYSICIPGGGNWLIWGIKYGQNAA